MSSLGNITTFFQSCQYILYAYNLQTKVVFDPEVVLPVKGRRSIYMNSNIMLIACVTLFIAQLNRIFTFNKVRKYNGLKEGRDEIVFILSLTMFIEIPLGVLYIALSGTMFGGKAQEILPNQYVSCMACSCVIFFVNFNLTLRAIDIFNDAVEDDDEDAEDASITFAEVNRLPIKNVDNKCLVVPMFILHMIMTITILIVANRNLLDPEHCLIDGVNENKEPVCLFCNEFYDINSKGLCEIG